MTDEIKEELLERFEFCIKYQNIAYVVLHFVFFLKSKYSLILISMSRLESNRLHLNLLYYNPNLSMIMIY